MEPHPAATGPLPRTFIDDASREDLVRKVAMGMDDQRKKRAFERWQIWTEDFGALICGLIDRRFKEPKTQESVRAHVKVAHNATLDLARKVCVVYREGVQRSVEGASSRANDAFRDFVRETKATRLSMQWHRMAWAIGPLAVVPCITEAGRFKFETLLPHFYDIIEDPDDRDQAPLAVAWNVRDASPILTNRRHRERADIIALDAEGWWYYDTTHSSIRLVGLEEHGMGRFPGSYLRMVDLFDDDWWAQTNNERVRDATVEIGFITTVLSWLRKSQNKLWPALIGDVDGIPKGQVQHPETPFIGRVGEEGALDLQVHNFSIPIKEFREHVELEWQNVLNAFGIPDGAASVEGTSASPSERLTISHQGLTEIRNEHIPFCREFEEDLWPKAVELARRRRHKLASLLPDEQKVRDGFSLTIPKLSRQFADPKQEREHKDWLLSKGQTSQKQLMREQFPTLSEKQVDELLERNLDEQAKFNDEVTKRNLGMSQNDDVQTAAQANGAAGGRDSGVVRKQQAPEKGDDNGRRADSNG